MPTKADHNRTHLVIVHSPCLVSPLCAGWRKEDHTARPQAWQGPVFLPFFAPFSNRKGSLGCGNGAASRLSCGRQPAHQSPATDRPQAAHLRSFFEKAE